MQGLSVWILSIVGICLFSVVIDLILPSGKTNSSIKKVVSYAIVLVVIMPIPSLINGGFNTDGIFENSVIELQDNYIYNLNQAKLEDLKNKIETDLQNAKIYGAVVSISANVFDSNMEIFAIYVNTYNLVITENDENINIKKTIKTIIKTNIAIEEEKIIFYEWKI